ncbi:MAG: cobalamin biosynthesis protein CobD, partial [Pseudonocardiales bacterium]|nr:cobalamin biosynthesis protein CobD [Pseudonocardiales bacterium]
MFADPRRGHPVAAFGRAAQLLERRLWRDSTGAGVAFTAASGGAVVALGLGLERATRRRAAYPLAVTAATWAVLGGETLRREAAALHELLDAGELPAARSRLTHLVGRDTVDLDESEVARAAVESVAENTSDAVVAPLFWGAVAGIPGLLGYRAVNTLDAMVGHRSARYRRFGWASARLDDLANLVPARATAVLVALVSGRPRDVLRIAGRDARRHPSPNSGWCEAAFAGALELRLGGVNGYGQRVEERPSLGDGKPAQPRDLPRAAALAGRVAVVAAVLAAAAAA